MFSSVGLLPNAHLKYYAQPTNAPLIYADFIRRTFGNEGLSSDFKFYLAAERRFTDYFVS